MAVIGSTSSPEINATIDAESVTNPAIVNLAMATANTEYSYAFPATTRKFFIQNRDAGILQLRHVSASTEYVTIFPGQVYSAEFLAGGSTVYLTSPKASQTAEIEYWLKT
jgi:hypothetical protein